MTKYNGPTDATVCLYFPAEVYKQTNFDGAALSVSVLNDKTTDSQCLDVSNDAVIGHPTTEHSNGITFEKVMFGGNGATGHTNEGNSYVTCYKNACFDIARTVGKYRDDGETPKRFIKEEQNTGNTVLNHMFSTCQFIN